MVRRDAFVSDARRLPAGGAGEDREHGEPGEHAEPGKGTRSHGAPTYSRSRRETRLARDRVRAGNVTFQAEDCQRTSLPDAAFDTAFLSLVLHFTAAEQTLAEMRRILKPRGTLLISNLDPGALRAVDRVRSLLRVLDHGLAGYRAKPPKGFGRNVLTGARLAELLRDAGFAVVATGLIHDPSRSSNIPLDFIKALRA